MGIFKKKSSATADRRKTGDRRTRNMKLPYDRRVQPDRRLNNIRVEWIPLSEITLHPALRKALSHSSNRKKATGIRSKDH